MTISIPQALPRHYRADRAAPTPPVATELRTWANLVTLIRTLAGLALFTVAAVERSLTWNLAGLAAYWGLDMLDGFLARHLDIESWGVLSDELTLIGQNPPLRHEPTLNAPVRCAYRRC